MKHYKKVLKNIKKQVAVQQDPSLDFTLLQNSLKSKESELARLKKEKEAAERTREELLKAQQDSLVRAQLEKTARKLNVRDTAIDDVISLVGSKFVVKDNKVIPVDNPELEPEKYMEDWLSTKEHYVAPTVAKSMEAPPFPSSTLPVVEFDPRNPESINNYIKQKWSFDKK